MSRRAVRGVASALGVAVMLAWSCGLAWFTMSAMRPPGPVAHADGIVALTGGARRVEAALSLLREGRADALLISGVPEGTSLPDLLGAAGLTATEALSRRITLGHDATTTVGNAMEAATWARTNDLRSLIVVTAGYHMRRALAEIGRAIPGVALIAYPVRPPALERGGLGTLRLLVVEYTKWLAVEAGLTGTVRLPGTA